jgi:hypothetical protein
LSKTIFTASQKKDRNDRYLETVILTDRQAMGNRDFWEHTYKLFSEFYEAGTRGMDRNLLVVCANPRNLEPLSAFGISLMRMGVIADKYNLEDDNNIVSIEQSRAEIALRNTLDRDALSIRDICAINGLDEKLAERLVNILRLKRNGFEKSTAAIKNLNTPEFEYLNAFNKKSPAKHFSRWEYASIFAQYYCSPTKTDGVAPDKKLLSISQKMSEFLLNEDSQQHIGKDQERADDILLALVDDSLAQDQLKDAPTRNVKRITEMYLTAVSKLFLTAPTTAVKLKPTKSRSNEQENRKFA